MEKIPCSIGILTYNSGQLLERCFKSVAEFAEIIISDGGSADDTLKIAEHHGCKIIQQSQIGQPIEDFSLERNRMLDVASYDWFFYLDSDEVMSSELKGAIRKICENPAPEFLIYRVIQQNTSPDLKQKYQDLKTRYQTRFFNKKTGARFIKKVHERIKFDKNRYQVGTINAPWYVPLSLDFNLYKTKVNYRLALMAQKWRNKNPLQFIWRCWLRPVFNMIKQFIKITGSTMLIPPNQRVPARYELFRVYSEWVFIKKFTQQYLKNLAR